MKEVKKTLEQRIKKLERELQDELPKALKKALEHGDLRENAEYQTAKERQSFVQAELAQLKERLAKLSMVNLTKIPEGARVAVPHIRREHLTKAEQIAYEQQLGEWFDSRSQVEQYMKENDFRFVETGEFNDTQRKALREWVKDPKEQRGPRPGKRNFRYNPIRP